MAGGRNRSSYLYCCRSLGMGKHIRAVRWSLSTVYDCGSCRMAILGELSSANDPNSTRRVCQIGRRNWVGAAAIGRAPNLRHLEMVASDCWSYLDISYVSACRCDAARNFYQRRTSGNSLGIYPGGKHSVMGAPY